MRKLVDSKTIFISFILTIAITILLVYINGRDLHRSLYQNAILSTSILSLLLFILMTIGLYRGWKMWDTIKSPIKHLDKWQPDFSYTNADIALDGNFENPLGCLGWLILVLLAPFIIWLAGAIFLVVILGLASVLYWIFFRALRLVLKKSPQCRGNLLRSMWISFGYAMFYSAVFFFFTWALHYASVI